MPTDTKAALTDGSRFDTADKLRFEMVRLQIEQLRVDIAALRQTTDEQERRIRNLEETATKFNFLLYLTMGGGLVGLINLGLLAFSLVKNMTP